MKTTVLREKFHFSDHAPMNRWLQFVAPIQAHYNEAKADKRVTELRSAIYVGLILYNVYNLTSVVLLPDCLLWSIVLRLGLVTPISLSLAWSIGRMSPLWTERVVTVGVLNAYLVPVFLFWISREPRGLFTFGELPLTIIFADMLMALRFPHAVVFSLSALAATLLAVATKSGLDASLLFAFAVQITTACAFGLYANYRQEHRRCMDFLVALTAKTEAHNANADSQTYRSLSHTDALTRLPNRRYLTEKLEEWLSGHRAVAVMMIDVDFFKLYNDALGHPAGDDCLRRVADTFARIASESDEAFCARFGGEEFTFVLRDAGDLEAARLARSILQAIVDLAIPHPARSDGVGIVTVSIGMARCEGSMICSLQDILAAADCSLYTAKRRGRNRFLIGERIEQRWLGDSAQVR